MIIKLFKMLDYFLSLKDLINENYKLFNYFKIIFNLVCFLVDLDSLY